MDPVAEGPGRTVYQERLGATALRLRIFFCIQRIAKPPTEIRSHFLIAVPFEIEAPRFARDVPTGCAPPYKAFREER